MIQILNVTFVPIWVQLSSRHMPEQQPFIRCIGLSYFGAVEP